MGVSMVAAMFCADGRARNSTGTDGATAVVAWNGSAIANCEDAAKAAAETIEMKVTAEHDCGRALIAIITRRAPDPWRSASTV